MQWFTSHHYRSQICWPNHSCIAFGFNMLHFFINRRTGMNCQRSSFSALCVCVCLCVCEHVWRYLYCWGLLFPWGIGKSLDGKLPSLISKANGLSPPSYKTSLLSTWMGCSIPAVWILASCLRSWWPHRIFTILLPGCEWICSFTLGSARVLRGRQCCSLLFSSGFGVHFKYCSFAFSESWSETEGDTGPCQSW